MSQITASVLYDIVECPPRPTMDLLGNPAERDAVSLFVQLLWGYGTRFDRRGNNALVARFDCGVPAVIKREHR